MKKLSAEFIGTFWLVFGGCGSAILAGQGIGLLGISLAFGLTVLTMAYAIGHISGCHLNPAVTLGLVAGGRFSAKQAPGYIIAQVLGAILAGFVLMLILQTSGKPLGGFAANGFGSASPSGFNMISALIIEMILTAVFLFVIMGTTSVKAPSTFAPIAIGLCLTLIHLISIPVTNTSVNPARSTGVALFAGSTAIKQLWLFWVAPIAGGIIGAIIYNLVTDKDK